MQNGQSKGYGFIHLKTPEAADAILSTAHILEGRK